MSTRQQALYQELTRLEDLQLNHQPNALSAAAQGPPMIVPAAAVAVFAAAIFALHPPATQAAQAKGATVSTTETSLVRIIVDSRGRTLYLFEKDRNGKARAPASARPSAHR